MARMEPSTYGLQVAGPGGDLPAEWQALIASQASTLAELLSRIETAAATLRQQQAPAAQLQALAAEAERVLTAQAQEQVRLERELVELRALVMDFSTSPSALAARVRTLESAIEVLHGNLATARQYLATLFPQEP
jgi:chromosome segregation ATPase